MPATDRYLFAISILFISILPLPSTRADEYRATNGLQVLYDFKAPDGAIVYDRSESNVPINLEIRDSKSVRRSDGSLQVVGPTILQTEKPPARLINAVQRSGEVTVEAWIQPADTKQAGPARVVTISKDANSRNFTLGQDGNRFDVRLRTTRTSTNGIPSLPSVAKSATTKLTHVLYAHSKDGKTHVYVNGKSVGTQTIRGDLSNWDKSFRLAIGNELSGDRPWLGTLHLVAVYSRALTPTEIAQNFAAGPDGRPSPELIAKRKHDAAARHFETKVAPLLARHCLECHDSATHANGLDLSKKLAAFKGGANGKSIIPGNSAKSELFASVEAETMPQERPPLSMAEKSALKKWIDEGAVWTLSEIDPAIYVHESENQNFVQRLTVSEYVETVRSTVGVDIATEAREILPKDLRADGFSNTAYNLNVDLKHVNSYAQLAELIVSRMDVRSFVSQFSKRRKFTDKDMGEVIERVGEWVLRGPVSEREVIAYRGITTTVASAGGTFDEAMAYVLEAMLQSPRFIYRVEQQQDGDVDAYELASRLSYIIWGGPPDKELLQAAGNGLQSEEVEKQAERMLNDPRAIKQSLRFAADWLNLGRLENLRPNEKRFPNWNAQLAEDMQAETLAYFEEVVWNRNKRLSSLMNSQVTIVSPELASFYGFEPKERKAKSDRYDLTTVASRGGILTQASLLTVGGDNASMVTRGLLVMHELLRGVVKDPPPCVDTTPIQTKPGVTQRSIALQRIGNASCGGCHSKFEPLAFGLEKFDGIGAHHDVDEHGNELRDDGEILFPGASKPIRFRSSAELMNLLANSERVAQSLTWKIVQFALGRPLVAEDAATVDKIHREGQKNGGTWTAIMKAIVTSDLVMKSPVAQDR